MSARAKQRTVIADYGITAKGQSQCVALENGLAHPLLAPPIISPLLLSGHSLPYVMCRHQVSSDKGFVPGSEFPDGCRLKCVWTYRSAAQSVTAQGTQENCFDNTASIPVWVAADRFRVNLCSNQGLAPRAEGKACCAIQPAIVSIHGCLP